MPLAQTSLWFFGGVSDKVYTVTITKVAEMFFVEAKWGRRNGRMQRQGKGFFGSRSAADAAYLQLVSSKVAKGYQVTGMVAAG